MKKTKIIIVGIGGVGGYFGGLLAHHYPDQDLVEINFVARGKHLEEIQTNGLKIINGDTEFIAKPTIATENPSEIGIVDLVIFCTKNYDLESAVQQLNSCIDDDTILLPLLNGVSSKEKIKAIYPKNTVLDGCVYIISRLRQPGVVENSGNIQKLYFGLDHTSNAQLIHIEKLFKEAKIDASLSKNISTIIWEKFIFVSSGATATSYFNKSMGSVLEDTKSLETLTLLIEEIKELAKAKSIVISEGITENILNKMRTLPFEATSSMHSDFKNNKPQNELESLTGYVLVEGQKYNLKAPTYSKMYHELKKKSAFNV